MKYRLTYQSESRLLTVDFLIYLQDEDIAGFKRHVKLKVKERRVDLLFIDFTNLEKKGLPPITRKGREALAGIAATYKPERIALVNVPALLSCTMQPTASHVGLRLV